MKGCFKFFAYLILGFLIIVIAIAVFNSDEPSANTESSEVLKNGESLSLAQIWEGTWTWKEKWSEGKYSDKWGNTYEINIRTNGNNGYL